MTNTKISKNKRKLFTERKMFEGEKEKDIEREKERDKKIYLYEIKRERELSSK